ncbi:MAG: serpin family protein [Gemmatimonadaceae bacterium]|nr:serpin family protein [Gemmatimonadaceae bacterium]
MTSEHAMRRQGPGITALVAALSSLLLLGACTESGSPTEQSPAGADSLTALPRALTAAEQEGVQANTHFALHLLRTTSANESDNVLLSPLSVSFALGMTMNGATGETFSEMQRTLGWGSRSRGDIIAAYRDLGAMLPALDTSVAVHLANGIWMRQGFTPDTAFVRQSREFFKAPVLTVATPPLMYDSVNAWAKRETRNMIEEAVSGPPPSDLVMLLANAVYFAGSWRNAFDVAQTTTAPFTLASGATAPMPMMRRSAGFNAYEDQQVRAAELLYGNGAYSMVLVQPKSGTAGTLARTLDVNQYGRIVQGLRPAEAGSILTMPKFSVRGTLKLSEPLAAMGMPRAFSGGAEFPFLVVGSRTQISEVTHVVALDVFERGTRAAAVTVVEVVRTTSAQPVYNFDKPFVFFIRDRLSGTVLFTGLINDPRN